MRGISGIGSRGSFQLDANDENGASVLSVFSHLVFLECAVPISLISDIFQPQQTELDQIFSYSTIDNYITFVFLT